MSDVANAANEPAYFTERQRKGLSPEQQWLLRRVYEQEQAQPSGRWARIKLEPHEVAAATGLDRRGLARTDRPSKGLFHRRPIPGTKRDLWLTKAGRALAATLPASPPASTSPLGPKEAKDMLREIAEILAEHRRPTAEHRKRAEEILARLNDDEFTRPRRSGR